MKILVIRFSSIGDIVLTTPVVRALKKQLGAEVHYLTKAKFSALLRDNPYIDAIHEIEHDVDEVLPRLNDERFSAIVDLHNNLRSWRVKRVLKTSAYSFPKLNLKKWLLVNFKLNLLPGIHIVERYMQAAEPLGATLDGAGLDFFIPERENLNPTELHPALKPNTYVAFVIGGNHEGKMLSEEKILRLCQKIEGAVALLGGPEDAEKGKRIAAAAGKDVVNLAGELSLMKSASVLKQARVVLTHDTGLMHIAAAFGKKVISLWGGTVPELGMTPFKPGPGSKVLEVKHPMRPPSKLGKRRGIYHLWHFMDMIPDAAILDALREKTDS